MPRIFDNIEKSLLPALQQTLEVSHRADFCVGYFNLRGWKRIDALIEQWDGTETSRCRLLVGMQRLPQEELHEGLRLAREESSMDNQTALRLKRKLAAEFREQLTIGVPTNEDEAGLQRLASQIRTGKVAVKLFLQHSLHAKLYLAFREDPDNPITGYLGSSNLTLAGLSKQGELNIDVLDQDASQKLARWFEDRWNDRLCLDISRDLVDILDESWARETLISPYHIYLKMAYHLSQEARAGLMGFQIPRDFQEKLFEFQQAAVKIAAHHLNKRGGVLIGDVVGLGKTLMASAVARIFEDDYGLETLIICPKNLVRMWEDYCHEYRLRGRVMSLTQVISGLPELRRYRVVIIDESQNLRNREGKRYRSIEEYIRENDSLCILLSATPYNKSYLDLSSQLRLFVPDEKDIGIRPEQKLREMGELEFIRQHQCSLRSLAAFEKSEYADDWRELMRLYMVRRTRSFIRDNYAETDRQNGRKFLRFQDGTPSYFPDRVPRTVPFSIDESNPEDQYARLYAPDIVDIVNHLGLPRYGLGNYVLSPFKVPPTQAEAKTLEDLSRAGKRLMGFCRTNLFKRLESSGQAFIQSVERHIVRNYVYMYAIREGLPLPIGTQDVGLLDSRITDEDADSFDFFGEPPEDEEIEIGNGSKTIVEQNRDALWERAIEVYGQYHESYSTRFKWLRPIFFHQSLYDDLEADAEALLTVLQRCGRWDPDRDAKLDALVALLTEKHPEEKVLVFSQFADTVDYLARELKQRGIMALEGVTGDSEDPTMLAWHFSPISNGKRDLVPPEYELRALVATDVLSEGQNLQDCAIVVNYDLPWAIIRLIQRAGRVDRIGQQADKILCYTFLPAEGVDRIIKLRQRVRQRLQQNAEVVGTDEAFFEDDKDDRRVVDLYNEKAGILDDDEDSEVDLASYAYQIWKNAITDNRKLEEIVRDMPPVVYSTRGHIPYPGGPEGALVYVRTAEGNDALAWIDREGNSVTESQFAILRAAQCGPEEPPLERLPEHHELVARGIEYIVKEEQQIGGQLGSPRGARFRTYEALKRYAAIVKGTLFETEPLLRAIDDVYRFPLRQVAVDILNRMLRSHATDEALANKVVELRDEGRLSIVEDDEREAQEPRIICSMGLRNPLEDVDNDHLNL